MTIFVFSFIAGNNRKNDFQSTNGRNQIGASISSGDKTSQVYPTIWNSNYHLQHIITPQFKDIATNLVHYLCYLNQTCAVSLRIFGQQQYSQKIRSSLFKLCAYLLPLLVCPERC